jgi:hypothetical protein
VYTHRERKLSVSPAKIPAGSTLSSGASEIYLKSKNRESDKVVPFQKAMFSQDFRFSSGITLKFDATCCEILAES